MTISNSTGVSSSHSFTWPDFYCAVKACGFHLVFVVLIGALFFGVDQVQDMVQQTDRAGLVQRFFSLSLVIPSVYFSLIVWLTSRLIFDIKSYELHRNERISLLAFIKAFPKVDRNNYFASRWGLILPRLLAVAPLICVAAYALTERFWWVAFLALLSASLIIWFLSRRNGYVKVFTVKNIFCFLVFVFISTSFIAIFAQSIFILVFHALYLIWWGLGSMFLGFFLVAYFTFDTLNYVTNKLSPRALKGAFEKPYPILVPVIILPLLAGALPWSDNHQVRYIEAPKGTPLHPIGSLSDAFAKFKANSYEKIQYKDEENRTTYIPVFLVGSQGGGLRAAYWTALALNRLEKLLPGFENNVFLLSGASGGSVGNAFYLASKQLDLTGVACEVDGLGIVLREQHNDTCLLSNAVGKDYLSSLAASFMYNDLLYTFIPAPIPIYSKDRATYLEQAFEKGFADVYGKKLDDELDKEFDGLGSGYKTLYQSKRWNPIFLGTSTIQETGLMSIYAPFPIKNSDFNNKLDTNVFINSGVEKKWISKGNSPPVLDMRLSTVAVNSARFPYITPTGTLNVEASRENKFHTADAGYFDNYGAATVLDVIRSLTKLEDDVVEGWRTVYVPVPVILKNDITVDKYGENNSRGVFDICKPNISGDSKSIFAHELLSPIQALTSIRGGLARTKLSELIHYQKDLPQLKAMLKVVDGQSPLVKLLPPDSPVVAFYYQKQESIQGTTKIEPPLGWWLSEESKLDMLCQTLLFPSGEDQNEACKHIKRHL